MTDKRISRRDFLRLGAMTGAGAILAACASQATEAPEEMSEEMPKEEEPVSEPPMEEGAPVQYWVGWGGTYAGETWDALQETDEFKDAIGNNTFELKGSVPYEAFLTAVAGGTPPDGASNVQYLEYMSRGVLKQLDDLAATSAIVQKDNFIEGSWQQAFYEGKMLGVPANECFLRFGMNYNTRMIEAAGLDPDNPPETWDEWYQWHEAITEFDATGNLVKIGLDPTDAMGEGLWDSDGWMVPTSWGFDWFEEDNGTFNLNDPKMIESLEVMKKFIDLVGVDNMSAMRSVEGQGTWGASFNAEVQAMIIEGYWHPGETSAEKPEILEFNRATWLPVPSERKGVKPQGTGGHLVIIFDDSKNPEGMFKVAEFLNTQTAVDIIYNTVGWLPGIKAYQPDVTQYPGLDFYFNSIDEATEWHSPEKCPITGFVNDNYYELREYVIRGEMSAAEAADELQRRAEDEWVASGFGS